MNDYERKLFTDLEALVASNEAFYRQEFELEGSHYWIYNYRLASYTDFLAPSAMEARGIMFEVNSTGLPIRLAALPMSKFFNLNENPMTMNLDLSAVKQVQDKTDGSLMSTYIHQGKLRLKSKGSLFSEQALHAMEWLARPENIMFRDELRIASQMGMTINMEWTAPQHRIVIGYPQPNLTVLNIRRHFDGSYVDPHQLKWVVETIDRLVADVSFDATFIDRVPDMLNIEGFVVELPSGLRFKIKTRWYLALHHTKDSINSDRRLYESVLSEAVDDLRSMFYDDPLAIARIDKMQKFVDEKYNHLVKSVEEFHAANKDLIRKDYAIKGQQELDKHQFRLAMAKYLGQQPDYKGYMISKWKEYGLKDEPLGELE